MKITHKNDLLNLSLPLPIFNSIHIADAVTRTGDEFDIYIGLEKKYVEQLRELSLDESDVNLQKFTGDKNRFGFGSYEEWYGKNRTPFIAVDKKTDSLAAIIWFGPKSLGAKSAKFNGQEGKGGKSEIKDDWHTISFRSYLLFRGNGIMTNFTKFVIDIYREQFPNSMFWTGTDDRNTVFIKFISKLGFQVDKENSDLKEHWLIMTRTK